MILYKKYNYQFQQNFLGCFTPGIKAPKHYIEGDYEIENVLTPVECQAKHCRLSENCSYFAYIPSEKVCYLKKETAIKSINHETGVIFGPRTCPGKILNTAVPSRWI